MFLGITNSLSSLVLSVVLLSSVLQVLLHPRRRKFHTQISVPVQFAICSGNQVFVSWSFVLVLYLDTRTQLNRFGFGSCYFALTNGLVLYLDTRTHPNRFGFGSYYFY